MARKKKSQKTITVRGKKRKIYRNKLMAKRAKDRAPGSQRIKPRKDKFGDYWLVENQSKK